MLELYTWATPNGHKPQILLEELGIPYVVKPVNIFEGEQLTDAYWSINPNRRIPALIDRSDPDRPVRVFESGAILLYLAETFKRFLPQSRSGRSEAISWLMWQMGSLGPMLGQGQHFWTYATEKHPYSIERYTKEGHRLLLLMDRHLADHEYLADEYSIADIACFPWVRVHKLCNLSIETMPHLKRWYGAIRSRPAVEKGMSVLRDHLTGVPNTKSAHEVMFGEKQFQESQTRSSSARARGMLEINGMAHVVVTVSSFEASRVFYDRVLTFFGLKQVFEGAEFAYWVGGRTAVGIQKCGDAYRSEKFVQDRIGLHHMCFRAKKHDDVDKAAEFLRNMGATIVRGPQLAEWAKGYYYLLFEDPDQIRLEICYVPGGGVLENGASFNPSSDFKPKEQSTS